ncbi:MAG: dihydrofolate reductase [Devosiaceae bacterium]|nr:dihydrofolate reductase [Devosiaceae bacterium MH13]
MSAPEIVLIAAVARNGVIGDGQEMAFRLRSDLRRFKALTLGHPVVMGRATYQSIGKALPGRPNIIVSRDPAFRADDAETYDDLDTALDRARLLATGLGKEAVFILGGGQIYAQTMEDADRLEITHVEADGAGTVHFPTIDPEVWAQVAAEDQPAGEHDDADMVFATYRRR